MAYRSQCCERERNAKQLLALQLVGRHDTVLPVIVAVYCRIASSVQRQADNCHVLHLLYGSQQWQQQLRLL